MTSAARRFRHAVVAGKFYPPHRGHQFLIDSALVASDRVSVLVCERPSDLLAGDEIPFEPDEIRDGESIRHEMQGWFREELGRSGVPWIELRGDRATRLAGAVAAIDARRREVAVLDQRVPDRRK